MKRIAHMTLLEKLRLKSPETVAKELSEYYSRVVIQEKILDEITEHYTNLYGGEFKVEEAYVLAADVIKCYTKGCLYVDEVRFAEDYIAKTPSKISIDAVKYGDELLGEGKMLLGYIHIHPPGIPTLSNIDRRETHISYWLKASFLLYPHRPKDIWLEIDQDTGERRRIYFPNMYFKPERNVITLLGIIEWDTLRWHIQPIYTEERLKQLGIPEIRVWMEGE